MAIDKEILSDYKEEYEKALNYVNEESKNDPPTEPFRSHYKARDILLEVKKVLKDAIASVQCDEAAVSNEEDEIIYKAMLAFVCRDLGRIYVFTEECPAGEIYLKECLELIKPYKLKPEAIIPYVGANNELGILNANREDYPKSLEYLLESENTYNEFNKLEKSALALSDIFGTADEVEKDKGCKELEGLYTLCTFYFAQVYGHLGDLEKSAYNCNLTLRRQIRYKSYESIDFALNAATLSQYYIRNNKFKEARHHLAAATLIMAEYESEMIKPEMNEEERAHTLEQYKHRYADVARCWAKYGLALLSASKDRLLADDEEKLTDDIKNLIVNNTDYKFKELNLSAYEERISADYCLTFDDAKLIYHLVIMWLDEAKTYYKIDTEASEYAKIIQDFAELYQHMAFFEEDPVNQAKMHKRRAKYYEELVVQLNPTYFLGICRECWYGAGLAYCAILEIRLDNLKVHDNAAPQELQKINQACQQAIKYFKEFIKTYTENDETTLKANQDDDELRNVFYAFFHLGRLYFKIITPDPAMKLENLNNSYKYYKVFIDYCEAHTEVAKTLQAEIGVCKEMVHLLPLKIHNVRKH